jgi:tetratricopeptide (TPR) repeat protein
MALPHGPVSTFHPNGELASRGEYVEGKLEGLLVRFASSDGAGEPLRPCCVPPGASELRAEYKHGALLRETFFDAAGRPLCGDGTPWPARPAGIPEAASYDESSKRYYEAFERANGESSTRYFDADGRRVEELDLSRGRLVARRRFAPDGLCVESWELDGHGVRHGAAVRRFPVGTSPYADARIREEHGQFEQGERAGELRLFDADGSLSLVTLGQALSEGAGPLVLGALEAADAEELWQHAERLREERRAREAMALALRALGRSGDVARFETFHAAASARLYSEAAQELAHSAASEQGTTPSRLLVALLCGATPALVVRTLAATVPPEAPAALDYTEASLRLSPDDPLALMLRGLARLERGDREAALADARAVTLRSPAAGELLDDHCRCVFARFPFDPAEQPVSAGSDQLLPVGFEQSLEAAQRAVRLYATRIAAVRSALVAKVGDAPWLPPDTRELLAEGPIPLESYTARIEDETEEGMQVVEVPVDETLSTDGLSVRRLMTAARSSWAALSWLCWSVGLDRVAMPDTIAAPALFAEAANRAALRCFWAHDRLRTGGLMAAARHVPTFSWEGMPIENMPSELVEIAAAEYLEVRAMFLWALFPQNVSPFQADLRKV